MKSFTKPIQLLETQAQSLIAEGNNLTKRYNEIVQQLDEIDLAVNVLKTNSQSEIEVPKKPVFSGTAGDVFTDTSKTSNVLVGPSGASNYDAAKPWRAKVMDALSELREGYAVEIVAYILSQQPDLNSAWLTRKVTKVASTLSAMNKITARKDGFRNIYSSK